MAKRPNHYEILGVTPSVSQNDLKKAYRQLVKKFHPDVEYGSQTDRERVKAKEFMQHINEAYAILKDKKKRLAYDYTISANVSINLKRATQQAHRAQDEERKREYFLGQVFHPNRRNIVKVLNQYKKRLSHLEQDIYDDALIDEFREYVDSIEATLRQASNSFTQSPPPESLQGSVQWMRHSIAQAADGLDELHYFLNNYDYDHLGMASNLFKIALEHAAKALKLTKL